MTGAYESAGADRRSGDPDDFARRLKARERLVGYWIALDSPISTERIARLGYDYVCFDGQHGLLDYDGILRGLLSVDAGNTAAGVVRVGANDQFHIGRALDSGARAIIVPLVDSAEEAAAAVRSSTYPPVGVRSYGPMRSALRVGPAPAAANEAVATLAMIETVAGLSNVEQICAVPGLAGVYVGPSDLTIALGGASSTDAAVSVEFEAALVRIREAAAAAGVAAGIHTSSGADSARRLDEGFTFASISSDLTHLEQAAAGHLSASRSRG